VLPGMLLYLGEASIAVGERTDELFKSP
jgi:hypothetical protein